MAQISTILNTSFFYPLLSLHLERKTSLFRDCCCCRWKRKENTRAIRYTSLSDQVEFSFRFHKPLSLSSLAGISCGGVKRIQEKKEKKHHPLPSLKVSTFVCFTQKEEKEKKKRLKLDDKSRVMSYNGWGLSPVALGASLKSLWKGRVSLNRLVGGLLR